MFEAGSPADAVPSSPDGMTPAELRKLGKKHGRGWQARLARDLPVNARTIRRWLSGKTTMHPAIAKQIRLTMAGWSR